MATKAQRAKESASESEPVLIPQWDPDAPEIVKSTFDLEMAGDPPEMYVVCRECDEVFPKDTMLMAIARHAVTHVPGAPARLKD